MVSKGGTQMYCASCGQVQVCRAVPTTDLGHESGQRWYSLQYTDLQWFRRGRECQECADTWLTSEIREDFLRELIELREALGDLKQNAERYMEASQEASEALNGLTESLEVLRALRLYRQQT